MGHLATTGYFVLAALIVLIPFAIVWLLAWWFLRKRAAGKIVLTALSVVFAAVYLWTVVPHEPPDGFFKKEFQIVTGAPFPASGKFVFKREKSLKWGRDGQVSCALIEISPQDYEILSARAPKINRSFLGQNHETRCLELLNERVPGGHFGTEVSEIRTGEWVYWGLILDQPKIFTEHVRNRSIRVD